MTQDYRGQFSELMSGIPMAVLSSLLYFFVAYPKWQANQQRGRAGRWISPSKRA